MIRKAEKEDLEEMARLYKQAFKKHGIFEKPEDEVAAYLDSIDGELLAAEEDGKIIGGLLLIVKEPSKGHKLAGFKHVAVLPGYQGKGIGSELLKEAEKIVGKGKIEIHAAESEKDIVDFYRKNGYEIEGRLKSHYRPGETCYVLGKVL